MSLKIYRFLNRNHVTCDVLKDTDQQGSYK